MPDRWLDVAGFGRILESSETPCRSTIATPPAAERAGNGPLSNKNSMNERLTRAFVAYLAGNKGPEGQPVEYGISAEYEQPNSVVALTLVFKRGVRYCCIEWGCHFGASRPGGWDELRECFSAAGVEPTSTITLHLQVVVEQGAVIITNWPQESGGQQYEKVLCEDEKIGYQTPRRPPNYTGVWTTYGPNGQKSCERPYVDGRLHGQSIEWNGHGQKLKECNYKDGQRHGTLTQWNCENEVIDVSEWDNGIGTYRIFYASGQLSSEHQMRYGKPHGITKQWNGKGELTCTECYNDGKLISREGTLRWRHLCAFQGKRSDSL